MAFCPMAAVLILVYRQNKADGVTELLARSFDFPRIQAKRRYAPVFPLMDGVNVAVYGLMRRLDLPEPAAQRSVPPALLMFGAFFVGALGCGLTRLRELQRNVASISDTTHQAQNHHQGDYAPGPAISLAFGIANLYGNPVQSKRARDRQNRNVPETG